MKSGYQPTAIDEGVVTDDALDPYWGDGTDGPSIDLTVHFAYNSANLRNSALPVLQGTG